MKPPYSQYWGTASYGVCPCCGYEFGNDDDTWSGHHVPDSFEAARSYWLKQMKGAWLMEEEKPAGWLKKF